MEYQKITKASKNPQQNISETDKNEIDKEIPNEIPKERYISPEKRQKIIDNFGTNIKFNNGISINNKLVRQYTISTN